MTASKNTFLLQETWTKASRDLYSATKGKAYFKEIDILLPRTWDRVESEYTNRSINYDKVSKALHEL